MEENKQKNLYTELDEIDFRIVSFLQENARLPFTQIASELGVTERTVRLRVAQMQKDGILSLVGVVNPVKTGINVQSLIQVAVIENKLNSVVEKLQEIYEVRLVLLTSGDYQLMLEVFTRNHEELSQFLVSKLNCIEGISRTNVIVELKVLKSRFKFIR
jgi:Lrp/AsnC family transcriptional regulator for asnA, asnC and gidA